MIRGEGEGENLWKWVPPTFDCRRGMPPGPRLAVRGSPPTQRATPPFAVSPTYAFAPSIQTAPRPPPHPCPNTNMHVRTRADTPRSQSLSSCEAIYPHGLLSWRPLATPWSARRPSTLFGTRRSAKRDPSEGTPPLAHPRYRFTCDYTSFSLSRPSSPITPDVSWPSAVSNRTLHIRQ